MSTVHGMFMNVGCDLHFDEGVRVAVGVHGGQVGTAYDPNHQAALLRVVAQRHQDASTLGAKQGTPNILD